MARIIAIAVDRLAGDSGKEDRVITSIASQLTKEGSSAGGSQPSFLAPLLAVEDLAVSFADRAGGGAGGRVPAVRGVSFTVHDRQLLAIVGESGSGKSVTALGVMDLLPKPAARVERGSIRLGGGGVGGDRGGRELIGLAPSAMRTIRGKEIAMIFQEPMTSLNPVLTVGEQVIEPIMLHQRKTRRDAEAIAVQAMTEVGIKDAGSRLRAHPHQFSGGMRQRVMIAMALACRPRLLVADEPTTALDVTVQAQILELLRELRSERGMGILLITHDLGVVAENADVVCVMLGGRVVEYADVFTLLAQPRHPYTRGLLACKPGLHERRDRLRTIRQVMEEAGSEPSKDGISAWWPADGGGHGGAVKNDDEYSLREVARGHWVGCRESGAVSGGVARPDLAFRREAVVG
jgi:ABC-type dipeptide/oligopeptide/nickel transport system ATPase component